MGTMGPLESANLIHQLRDAEQKIVSMKVAAGINPQLATDIALVGLRQMRADVANAASERDELLALLRDASPPFGSTSEKREKWVRGREDALGKRGP